MKAVRIKVDTNRPETFPKGSIDYARVDATTQSEIAQQQREDGTEAQLEAGKFARRTRLRLGLTQQEFSKRIEVPVETIRNWEQGKRSPTGAAKALLRILERAPEVALGALG